MLKQKIKKPVILMIIDGLGIREDVQGNGYKQSNTPCLDLLLKNYPNSILKASGESVGLPKGQIGNSEVGHLNIGAGEIVYTGLSLIQEAINNNKFIENVAFKKSINHAKKNNGTIQIIGMLSPGGVHSHEEHLFILLKALKAQNVHKVMVHIFTDGRDVKPRSAKLSLKKLNFILNETGYELGSIGGRLYGMDRDKNFDKTSIAYDAMQGICNNKFQDVFSYLKNQYNQKHFNDEFIEVAINENAKNFFNDGDSVIFFNFRPDRSRQLSHLIIGSNIYAYNHKNKVKNIQLTTMMKYEGINNADVAFSSWKVHNPIGKVISQKGLKQLRIAETQKYAHVTFFLDGGIDIEYPNSKRIMIESLKLDNFSLAPQMSAKNITNKLISVLSNYDFIVINYANCDMVGHTGNLDATIKAVAFLDKQISRIKSIVDKKNGTLFITADHGNAEITEDKQGNPATKHTTSDVFLISTDKNISLKNGSLANVAPTILDYMEIEKPDSMTHNSLIIK